MNVYWIWVVAEAVPPPFLTIMVGGLRERGGRFRCEHSHPY